MDLAANIIVLISGNGSNLKAIIEYIRLKNLKINISGVISDNPDAYGLNIAKFYNINTSIVTNNNLSSKNYNLSLLEVIKPLKPNLIILAGFMKILSKQFIENYEHKILNIHPSLLPKYPGLNTHQRVIDHKDCEHGCTVHYVTEQVDGGPIIKQLKLTVNADDTVQTLKLRVQKLEHELYPKVIESLII